MEPIDLSTRPLDRPSGWPLVLGAEALALPLTWRGARGAGGQNPARAARLFFGVAKGAKIIQGRETWRWKLQKGGPTSEPNSKLAGNVFF